MHEVKFEQSMYPYTDFNKDEWMAICIYHLRDAGYTIANATYSTNHDVDDALNKAYDLAQFHVKSEAPPFTGGFSEASAFFGAVSVANSSFPHLQVRSWNITPSI